MSNQAQKIRQSSNNQDWDGIDDPPPANFQQEATELDKTYFRTFTTEDGKKVLDHLISITINQPSWIPGVDASNGYAREGQNSIVREILGKMRRSANE